MSEEEFQKWIKNFHKAEEEGKKKNEEYRKQIIPSFLRIPLEGFLCEADKVVIADDLNIEKVSSKEREEFFKRAAGMDINHYEGENNNYFVTFKYESERQKAGGMDTGDRILMIAIYFAICGSHLIKINKGQSFSRIREEFASLGIARIPHAPWTYTLDASFTKPDIDSLGSYWPLFRDEFNKRELFALVARRYYFSLIRYQWEDKLIDMIIALEALLVPEETHNIGGTMSKRLSLMLWRWKKYDVKMVSRVSRECYALRNNVVHGEISKRDNKEAYDLIAVLQEFLKMALQIYLVEYSMCSHNEFINNVKSIIPVPDKDQ